MRQLQCAVVLACLMPCWLAGAEPPATAPVATQKADTERSGESPEFMRVSESAGKSIALEVASVWYERPDSPSLTLVGVAHIGDPSLYSDLQGILDGHDVVLYESVMPPGAAGPTGETDADREASTREAMEFVGSLAAMFMRKAGTPAPSREALIEFASDRDSRLRAWVTNALVDAWGHPIEYSLVDGGTSFDLLSLGADGAPGGEGLNADLKLSDFHPTDEMFGAEGDSLQEDLARALGLKFQLSAMDYDRPNWHCADMTTDQLQSAFRKKGLDFGPLQTTLAGSSFSAVVTKAILGIVRMADALTGGAMTDAFKVAMVEMLGHADAIDMSLDQLGEGLGEVLIGQRNDVVLKALEKVLDAPDVGSVGIFYGAGHMGDFDRKLREMGFHPVSTKWTPAITVDLAKSKLDSREIKEIQRMMRQAINQAARQAQRQKRQKNGS